MAEKETQGGETLAVEIRWDLQGPPHPHVATALRNVDQLCCGEVGSLFQNDSMSKCLSSAQNVPVVRARDILPLAPWRGC